MRTEEECWIPAGKWSQSCFGAAPVRHSRVPGGSSSQPRITMIELLGSAVILAVLQWYLTAALSGCHRFEEPHGPVYGKVTGSGVNDFRRKTVEAAIDPLLQVVERLQRLKRDLLQDKVSYDRWMSETREMRERLLEIQDEMLCRRVPEQFAEANQALLDSDAEATQALNALEQWHDAWMERGRTDALARYDRTYGHARATLLKVRTYYFSRDWVDGVKFK